MRAAARPRMRATCLLLVAALLLAGCGGAPQAGGGAPAGEGRPVDGGTVTIAQLTAPTGTFNPWVTMSAYDAEIAGLIYDSLLRLDERLGFQPNLAERYEVSPDGKTLTFRLKPGLVWSDGTPLTSADVRFTFEQVLHPEYPGAYQGDVPLKGAARLLAEYARWRERLEPEDPRRREPGRSYVSREEYRARTVPLWERWRAQRPIETPDPRTVVLHFDEPYAPALLKFGLAAILPKHVFERVPVREWATAEPTRRPPVASGPFRFVQYRRDQFTELVRNERYHLGKPHVERLIFRVIDGEVAIGALQRGEVDAIGVGASSVNPQDLDVIRTFRHVDVWETPEFAYQYLGVNLRHPFLRIKEVRQALAHAIDRQAIVRQLLRGHGTVMNTAFLPQTWAYDPQGIRDYPYDPARARQLLAAAGFRDTDGDGVLEKDGRPFTLRLAYPVASDPVRQASAPLIQSYLARVGIRVELEGVDFKLLTQRLVNGPQNREPGYDLWLLAWGLPLDPDQTGLWGEADPYNLVRWAPDTVGPELYRRTQELVREGVRTFDPERRRAVYRELGRIFNEHLPYVFLYTRNHIVVMNKRVHGVNRDLRGPLANVHEWWIPKEQQ